MIRSCVATTKITPLLLWQPRDGYTSQLLNCFLVDKHMMHWHAPQLFNFFPGDKHMMHGHHNFKLLLCWQTHDVWLQLLNCFLVEKHHKFQPWRKQLLNSFLMNTQHVDSTNFNWSCTKKFTIIRQGLFPSTSFYTSSKFRSWMVNHLFLEV